MHLTPIQNIPAKKWNKPTKINLRQIINDFVNSDSIMARVDINAYEYSSPESLYESLTTAIARTPYQNIKVCKRGTTIYIKKEDE